MLGDNLKEEIFLFWDSSMRDALLYTTWGKNEQNNKLVCE